MALSTVPTVGIEANVAIDAHLYGVVCGLLLGLLFVRLINTMPLKNQPQL